MLSVEATVSISLTELIDGSLLPVMLSEPSGALGIAFLPSSSSFCIEKKRTIPNVVPTVNRLVLNTNKRRKKTIIHLKNFG